MGILKKKHVGVHKDLEEQKTGLHSMQVPKTLWWSLGMIFVKGSPNFFYIFPNMYPDELLQAEQNRLEIVIKGLEKDIAELKREIKESINSSSILILIKI